jgi:biopolymer transport protein ExbD
VMADKSLTYDVIKKVLSTCTDADYGRVSFALMQKDKPVEKGQVRGT